MVAMEPPAGPGLDIINDRKADVFRAMPDADRRSTCAASTAVSRCGRRCAGLDHRDLRRLRLEIDNWRWSGVPFFLRTGKCLPEKVTEVRLVFQRAPTLHFARHKNRLAPNQLVLRIDPDAGPQ